MFYQNDKYFVLVDEANVGNRLKIKIFVILGLKWRKFSQNR